MNYGRPCTWRCPACSASVAGSRQLLGPARLDAAYRMLVIALRERSSGRRLRWDVSHDGDRPARVEDVHELALDMPHVTVEYGSGGNPVYQVGRKSFIFFRNPRPDAVDPDTGERYPDVIVFWVESDADKQALVQDETSPFFTTAHFDGHPSVLLRASRIGELTREELTEVIQDAWLSRASARRAAAWLDAHPPR
jgi:hypothetical protein